jgi:hypothetical protein
MASPTQPPVLGYESVRTVERPWWVKLCLLGLKSRLAVVTSCWLGVVLSVAVMGWGLYSGDFTDGRKLKYLLLFLALTTWYFATFRWIERHDDWPKQS